MADARPIVWVYMLRCSDGSYYTGSYRGRDLETRIAEHNTSLYPNAYTSSRRPVELVWSAEFPRYDEAAAFERQLKGWSRRKKEAVMRGDWDALPTLSRNRQTKQSSS